MTIAIVDLCGLVFMFFIRTNHFIQQMVQLLMLAKAVIVFAMERLRIVIMSSTLKCTTQWPGKKGFLAH